jgi:DNA-binding NarL/FixJ family response regulator
VYENNRLRGHSCLHRHHPSDLPAYRNAQVPAGWHAGLRPAAQLTRSVKRAEGATAAVPPASIVRVSTSRTRVALADDDVLLREGLASLLERSGFDVVGQCGEATGLITLVREHRPDLVLVDIRMPPTHSTEGLDAARAIREEFPQTAILVLSAHVEVEHAMDLLASGERTGYLLKSRVTDVDEFIETLGRVVKGSSVVDPALVQELVAARRAHDPLQDLTPREREVLALMAEGRSNAGIARQLWVTEGTVEKHVHHILGNLRLQETGNDHRRVLAVLTFLDAR